MDSREIANNVKYHRYASGLTQQELAEKSGLSLPTIKNIEGAKTELRINTVRAVAEALSVGMELIIAPARVLSSVRFRSCKNMRSREGIISFVAKKLDGFTMLEELLEKNVKPHYKSIKIGSPIETAYACRAFLGLGNMSPLPCIIDAITALGIKLLGVSVNAEKFYGLSVGEKDGGPAIILNKGRTITSEQMIFAAAHELGHILLHSSSYETEESEVNWGQEDEADLFASYFLVPEEGFNYHLARTGGLSFEESVIKVKQIFGVGYKTILHRLGGDFQTHMAELEKTTGSLAKGKELASLSKEIYTEARFRSLAVQAIKKGLISTLKGAEFLDVSPIEMSRLSLELAK